MHGQKKKKKKTGVGLSYSEVRCVIEVDRCILHREVFVYEHL